MINVLCMCGAGVGSSLLVVMGLQNILKKNGYDERDFHFEQADLTTGRGMANTCDILVTTPAFENNVDKDGPPVVYIKNLFSEKEIEEKFMPVLKKVLKNKKD